ncbi:MAG: TolC family protein [Pseudomonadota bacterium]
MRHNTSLLLILFLSVILPECYAVANEQEVTKISIKTVVELALINNLNLQLKRQDVDVAAGVALATQGKFDILLKGEGGAQNQEKTPIYSGGATEENTEQWNVEASKLLATGTVVSLGWNNSKLDSDADNLLLNPSYNSGLILGLRQSLLKGFGEESQSLATRASQKQLRAATFQVAGETANLAAEVKRAYWSLVYAWQNTAVQKLSLVLAQKTLEETEAKIKAGNLAEGELYQPQSEVARREELLIAVERETGAAEDELKLLINSKDWQQTFEPTDSPTAVQVELNPAMVLANALETRSDVMTADLLVEAAQLDEMRAKDNTRPDLALIGGVGIAETSSTYSDFSGPNHQWQVGIAFSVPLENRAAEGLYRQAKANYMSSKTKAELLRQQIRKNVRTSIRNTQLAIKALDATKKTSFATFKRLEVEQTKFGAGRSTTLDVLIAQEAYSQALKQQNITEINYANSLVELDRIQGLITFHSPH